MATSTQLSRIRHLARSISKRRHYHSYDHPPPPGPFSEVESLIFTSALPHIPAHGFSHTALSLGAKEAGYLDASTNLFPRGAFSLVHFYLVQQRLALANSHEDIVNGTKADGKPLGTGAKVKALTLRRLLSNRHIIHRWQEAIALMTTPSNLTTSLSELHNLSDDIWFLSGDGSVDTSWYTKRAALSTIYASSELFMTNDTSKGFEETEKFLDRRFGDNFKIGKAIGNVGQWVGFTMGAGINVLRSKGVRI